MLVFQLRYCFSDPRAQIRRKRFIDNVFIRHGVQPASLCANQATRTRAVSSERNKGAESELPAKYRLPQIRHEPPDRLQCWLRQSIKHVAKRVDELVLQIDDLKGYQPTQNHLNEDDPSVYSDNGGDKVQQRLHGMSVALRPVCGNLPNKVESSQVSRFTIRA